jgi:hypothetical protein
MPVGPLGHLIADLQCSLSSLDLHSQCGQLAVTVTFTVAISVAITVSVKPKQKVVEVKPDPPKPEPPKPPPPPDRAPTRWRVIAALLAALLLALCYGQASGSRAEQAVSHALGSVASPLPAPTSGHPPRITFRRHVEFHARYQLHQLHGHLGYPAHRRPSRRRRGG